MENIILTNELILLNAEAINKFDLLENMAENLYRLGYVKDTYKKAVIDREKIFATGLPTVAGGVAIPHADIQHVNIPAISIARLKNPVDFVVMGDSSSTVAVDLVFMLAMKEEHAQLELLQNLMGILQDKSALNFVKKAERKEDIRAFIVEKLK